MKFYTIKEILSELERCITYKLPFSHIRFGDGGIKFLDSILNNKREQLTIIIKKEGLPSHKIVDIFELWGYYARQATFIDSPEIYFNNKFWPRVKRPGKVINPRTEVKMRKWKELYSNSEFDNENFCNPESNYLMFLKRDFIGGKNLFDLMKGRKVCIITVFPEIKNVLRDYNIDIVKIVGHYENQYENSFKYVVDYIKNCAKNYDFWMVAAGELGRIYSGIIKEHGGRSVDVGFIIEFLLNGYIHPRFYSYLVPSLVSEKEFTLTDEGKKYLGNI